MKIFPLRQPEPWQVRVAEALPQVLRLLLRIGEEHDETLAFCRTNSARLDSESGWTSGSASLSRMVASVPPVKSMLYMLRPRAKNAPRPSTISTSEPAMQICRGPMKSKFGLSIIFSMVSCFSQPR